MSQQYQNTVNIVDKILHEPGKVSDIAEKIEKATGVKRIYIAQGAFGLFVLYMVFGYFAALVCNFVGFLYPAYRSFKAIESSNKDDDTRWLTYWVVFASFSVLEFFSDVIFSWFPLYWLGKVLFLVWCWAPVTENGTAYIYKRLIRPVFLKNSSTVDKFVDSAVKNLKEKVLD